MSFKASAHWSAFSLCFTVAVLWYLLIRTLENNREWRQRYTQHLGLFFFFFFFFSFSDTLFSVIQFYFDFWPQLALIVTVIPFLFNSSHSLIRFFTNCQSFTLLKVTRVSGFFFKPWQLIVVSWVELILRSYDLVAY